MAALTFLQLANALIQKCGIAGGNLPSVIGQTGESARVVAWINEAYLNVQQLRTNWLWMEADVSFQTVAAKGAYTPSECGVMDLSRWHEDSFRAYITSVGVGSEVFLGRMDYDKFRDTYLYNNIRNTTGQPISIAVGSDRSLNLGLCPGPQGYTVVGKYYRAPSDLVANGDLPLLPAQYHMLIVYEAMQSYAAYEAASEVMAEGMRQYRRMKKRLENDQLPRLTIGVFE